MAQHRRRKKFVVRFSRGCSARSSSTTTHVREARGAVGLLADDQLFVAQVGVWVDAGEIGYMRCMPVDQSVHRGQVGQCAYWLDSDLEGWCAGH